MYSRKTFLFAAIVLATVSISNAEMTLTINGLDAAKEPLEINGKNNLVITIAGQSDEKAKDISVTCDNGKLEPLIKPDKYLFNFTSKSEASTISLNVYSKVVYQLILFYIPETDTILVFGLDKQALAPPQPKSVPGLEQQISAPQTASSAIGGSGTFLAGGGGDSNDVLDPNVYPNLNNDQFVNFKDFAILAPNWRQTAEELDGDFDDSGTVDFNDLAIFAYYWLANTTGPPPEGVFESFKTALLADDLNAALACFTEISAENYEPFLEQLRPYFTQMVNDMGELVPISLDDNTAVYDLLREEDGDTYGYPVLFVRDEMGQWKISDF